MVSAFVIIKDGQFLQWNGVRWTENAEDAAMFMELNDMFSWAEMIEVSISRLGGDVVRQEFTLQQFRSNLVRRS